MQQKNVFEYLKTLYKQSGMTGKLILVNLIVFLFFGLLSTVDYLFELGGFSGKLALLFAGPGNPEELMYQPWSLITQLFMHATFFHLAFNMIALFFLSRIFVQFFGERRLLTTYILGGIVGYLFHIGCFYLIPVFAANSSGPVVGASGAIFAIFMAVAFHRPKLSIYFFGIVKMPIIVLALLYVAVDFFSVGADDNIAHLAHLGGAIFGALSIINVSSPNNFMNRIEKFFSRIFGIFKRKPKMKVYTSDDVKAMDDDAYRSTKANNQEVVDAILDKISKKGYEGLTKKEKEILFNESKRKQN